MRVSLGTESGVLAPFCYSAVVELDRRRGDAEMRTVEEQRTAPSAYIRPYSSLDRGGSQPYHARWIVYRASHAKKGS